MYKMSYFSRFSFMSVQYEEAFLKVVEIPTNVEYIIHVR